MVTLPQLARAQKVLSQAPVWEDHGADWKIARVPLTAPKLGVDGLYLRLKAPRARSGSGFMLQVEYDSDRDGVVQLERLEWKAEHTNPNQGPDEIRLSVCPSTHHHAFDLNYLPDEGRMRTRNLPLARPVEPDPATFEELLAFAEKSLRINGLETIVRPAFQGSLLP